MVKPSERRKRKAEHAKGERARRKWYRARPFHVHARRRHQRVTVHILYEVQGKRPKRSKHAHRDTALADEIMRSIVRTDTDYRLSTMRVRYGRR